MPEVVKEPLEVTPEGGGTPEIVPTPEVKPGESTDPALLLSSLKEEREKRRELQAQLELKEQELLQAKQGNDGADGTEVTALQTQINVLTETLAMKDLVEANPSLKGKEVEFKEFRKTYPGVAIDAVAKLFISENGLTTTARKGLESVGGGGGQPPKEGMSVEDIETLRKTNWRKYQKLLRAGKIKVST